MHSPAKLARVSHFSVTPSFVPAVTAVASELDVADAVSAASAQAEVASIIVDTIAAMSCVTDISEATVTSRRRAGRDAS